MIMSTATWRLLSWLFLLTTLQVFGVSTVDPAGAWASVAAAEAGADDDSAAQSRMRIAETRCDYQRSPVGIDNPHPRLFWKLESNERGQRQRAYQVMVTSSKNTYQDKSTLLWDSGRVESSDSAFVAYTGKPLSTHQTCWWKVRVWDKDNLPTEWSEPASWTMGVMKPEDWTGQWVKSDLELMDYQKELRAMTDFGMEPETEIWEVAKRCREMTKDITTAPAVWMRKEMEVQPEVKRATISVAGLGYCELFINGKPVSDSKLDPSYTDYQKRVLYVTHDVKSHLKTGKNVIGAVLGNGWFNLITPHSLRFYAADYIAPPRMQFLMTVEYEDGTIETVVSDKTWKYTTDGPITFNCVLAGETYDARKELTGWAIPDYDDSKWKTALPAEAPEGKLVAQMLPPVQKVATVAATTVTKHQDMWRFDLGEEATGWARLRVKGDPGQVITISYPGSGSHTLGRYQTCIYVCQGGGEEIYAPRFCYNGFQHVEVRGLSYEPQPSDLEGEIICSDLENAGAFACSDDRLNKLQEILLRTIRNYIVHVPNDPTREKAGWTQDIQSGFWETVYNVFAPLTYLKWQRDFLDAIHENGYMPPVVPGRFDGPTINGPWWGGVVVYAPWFIYRFYGDEAILAESYPAMQRHLDYLTSIAKDDIIEWGLGDWMEVGTVRPKNTPVALTSTYAYYYFAGILRDTADILGKKADAERYGAMAERIRKSYNGKFFDPATGAYAKGSQTAQVLSYFGLAEEKSRELVRQRLIDQITSDNMHISTGFVGTPTILTGLCEMDLPELAFKMATQPDYPGFIDAVLNHGHTVMKEDWKGGLVQMPSLQGPIGTYFLASLAGINAEGPGFKTVRMKPQPAGTLTWVKGHHESIYGRISSEWKKEDGKLHWTVTIPPNITGTLSVPASKPDEVLESGKPAAQAEGLKLRGQSGGRVNYRAVSGTYNFTAPLN